MRRRCLFIFRQPPYHSTRWRDGLDALLATAAFGQPVSVLLMGEAVLQLFPNQQPARLPAKSPLPLYDSLSLYEIDRIYVAIDALKTHRFPTEILPANAVALDQAGIRQLFREHDTCLSF